MAIVLADFAEGRIVNKKGVDIVSILDFIRSAQKQLADWPVERIIEILDGFATALLDRRNDIHKRYPNSGIPFIAGWCRKQYLQMVLNTAFEDRSQLDVFVNSRSRSDRAYKVFPRGVVVHWMAGNVPTLGFLSLIQGIITKNANLIKLASNSNDMLSDLLDIISGVKQGEAMSGDDLVKSIAVVRFDHSLSEVSNSLSMNADVRVMWGSDESVKNIKALPARFETTDIVFSNKVSIMLVSRQTLRTADIVALAKRVATDISIFEQKACASPHTIFLETDDEEDLDAFACHLKSAMQSSLRTIAKVVPSEREISAILNLRAQYEMFQKAWYSDGTEFTILSDNDFKIGPAIGNRTVFLRKVDNIERIAELITSKVQTVGIAARVDELERITSVLGQRGVQRFTQIGAMTHFESPWDGYLLAHYLVRWASRPTLTTFDI